MDRRNSAIPLKDLTNTNARIEPGAFIREQAIIEDGAVVMTAQQLILAQSLAKVDDLYERDSRWSCYNW